MSQEIEKKSDGSMKNTTLPPEIEEAIEVERYREALRTIAEWPAPEQDNMPGANMRIVAALALALASERERAERLQRERDARTVERDSARASMANHFASYEEQRQRAEGLREALRDVLGYWDDVQGKLIPEAWPIPYRAQKKILAARALAASDAPGTSFRAGVLVHLGYDDEEHRAFCGSTDAPITMGRENTTCPACLVASRPSESGQGALGTCDFTRTHYHRDAPHLRHWSCKDWRPLSGK